MEKYGYNIILIDITRRVSYYTYLLSCSLNWTTHLYLFGSLIYTRRFNYLDVVYTCILVPIIKDDLILLDWLKKINKIKVINNLNIIHNFIF